MGSHGHAIISGSSHPASLLPPMKDGNAPIPNDFCGNEMLDALKMKTILRETAHQALLGWWDGMVSSVIQHTEINKLASKYNLKRTAVLISGLGSPPTFQ